MSRLSAEIAKIATNCFLTTKISFANSIGDLAIKVGAEPEKILNAIGADSRIGNKYLSYGFGFGGPCFPRDNKALGLFARNNDYSLLLSEATDEINKRHLAFQLQEFLNKYSEDEKIIFDGITYKKGSLLLDESQQFALAFLLAKAGRKVVLRDQEVVLTAIKKDYETLFDYEPIR
jgi:nucleotide sugar dehydrogenase